MDRTFLSLPFIAATLLGLSSVIACQAPTLGDQSHRSGGKNTLSEECADLPPGALTSDGVRCPGSNKELDAGAEQTESDGGDHRSVGITTCQPAFETACKPRIVFTNGDPMNRGKVFTDVIPEVEKTEQELACVACSILYRSPDEIPANKRHTQINIVLDTHGGVAAAGGDQIAFDLDYIAKWKDKPADLTRQEMLGVLQHETTHLYQNDANGGTVEGIADLVRAQTGYYSKDRWRIGEGTWKDAYTASGNFYAWLTGPSSYNSAFYSQNDPDFPYKLNKALAGTRDDGSYDAAANLMMSLFGRTPEDLWDEYQRTAFPGQTAQTGN